MGTVRLFGDRQIILVIIFLNKMNKLKAISRGIILIVFFAGIFFTWANTANAEYKTCTDETNCKSICTSGAFFTTPSDGMFGGYNYYCTNGYTTDAAVVGTVTSGSTCTSQNCVSGYYCAYKSVSEGWTCQSKVADGTSCGDNGVTLAGSTGNLCPYQCSSGTYYLNSSSSYICGSSSSSTSATTAGTSTGSGSTSFTNPLTYTTVESLLTSILSSIQKIVVVLALVFIVIGALMILVSAGSPETAESGKKAITMAIVGLAIGIGAPSILKELSSILGWTSTNSSVTSAISLSQIALNVLSFLLGISGVLAIIMLIVGAIMYLTSAGDETRIESGKKIFINSLIGVVIIMAAMVIVKQIAAFFIVS